MDVGPRRQGIEPELAPSEVCPDCVSILSRGMSTQGKSPPCWRHDLHASSQHSPRSAYAGYDVLTDIRTNTGPVRTL
jgi:hypothetical protein